MLLREREREREGGVGGKFPVFAKLVSLIRCALGLCGQLQRVTTGEVIGDPYCWSTLSGVFAA
jgi:hypothetical protein